MVTISGTGCCVIDYLYLGIDYSSPSFKKYVSKAPGDGGLAIGKLSFLSALEKFAGVPLKQIQEAQGWNREPDKYNLGGPCIVALVNAGQLTVSSGVTVKYYGAYSDDATGERINEILQKLPIDISNYKRMKGGSSYCVCLSDPKANGGHGERSFAIQLGVQEIYGPEVLTESFFESDILYFGATALCPKIHDHLTELLRKGREKGRYNVVGTVFDHRNEARFPNGRWPMGSSDDSFGLMDLLMVDFEESLRISGKKDVKDACNFFIKMGVKAFTITRGPENGIAWSDGSVFKKLPITEFPICNEVGKDLNANPSLRGDTTGCGDNFAGGLLAYMGKALGAGLKRGELDLMEGVTWAVASGGFAVFSVGGTYMEKKQGEKLKRVSHYRNAYKKQIGLQSKL